MQDDATNVIEAIHIACKYIIKRAFKLFDEETRLHSLREIVLNLRLTSKDLNNSMCDELSLEIMHRWIKGRDRCARVTKRIEQLLQNNDSNSLFKFMDAVARVFSKRESVRLLSSFLVTITQHHKHILKDYMEFFTSRELHMTPEEYYSAVVERTFPFPGFTPQQVEKSLQIANENGWIEESLLLFNLFETNWSRKSDEVSAALSNGQKLNFDHNVSNRLNNLYRNRSDTVYHFASVHHEWWYSFYLRAKQVTTNNIMEILHNVSKEEAGRIMDRHDINKRCCRVFAFRGSQLLRYYYRHYDVYQRVLFNEVQLSNKNTAYTGLPPSPDHRQRLYLYHFYRAVAENDIEKAKQIHRENNIELEHFGHQPHPLAEYIRVVVAKKIELVQEMIDYLVENFGVEESLKNLDWNNNNWYDEEVAKLWPTIRPLIKKDAKIYDIKIWRLFFNENVPQSAQEFKTKFERSYLAPRELMGFILNEFSITSRGLISAAKMVLLLAWRYDSTCHLSKLPKELFKIIMELVNEPPLFIQYAKVVIDDFFPKIHCPTVYTALEHSGEIARFVRDHCYKIDRPWNVLSQYSSQRLVKRDAKYLRELFLEASFEYMPQKIFKYFCKHETDDTMIKRLVKYAKDMKYYGPYRHYPFLELAVAVRNMKLLDEFFKDPDNINATLEVDLFASLASSKKNKMSFEEAVELINQVRSKYVA